MWEMFVNVFGDSSVSCAMVFLWSLFVVGEESIEDAERGGKLGTTKTKENIARVTAILKNNHRATLQDDSGEYGIPKTIVHHILSDDLKKQKLCVCMICAACIDGRTTGTAHCSCRRLNHPPYSPDLSPPGYFAFSEIENGVEVGPICNRKRHSNNYNAETENYSYY